MARPETEVPLHIYMCVISYIRYTIKISLQYQRDMVTRIKGPNLQLIATVPTVLCSYLHRERVYYILAIVDNLE